jgi:hypothetical protein
MWRGVFASMPGASSGSNVGCVGPNISLTGPAAAAQRRGGDATSGATSGSCATAASCAGSGALSAAGAGNELRRQVDVSTSAFEANTAATTELNKRTETTAAQFQLLKNNLLYKDIINLLHHKKLLLLQLVILQQKLKKLH